MYVEHKPFELSVDRLSLACSLYMKNGINQIIKHIKDNELAEDDEFFIDLIAELFF